MRTRNFRAINIEAKRPASALMLTLCTTALVSLTPAAGFAQVVIDGGMVETVDGAGGGTRPDPWDTNDVIEIGSGNGDGTLNILNGGSVTSTDGRLGNDGEATGQVSIDGAGSTWTIDGTLVAGYERGQGVIDVTNGGQIISTQGRIAREQGTSGDITIAGNGSKWTARELIHVGIEGRGELTVADDAIVGVTDGDANGERIVYAGAGSAGTGVINIGAAAGQAARGAGSIDADEIRFGDGGGFLVFNHTETDHTIGTRITGNGAVLALNGTTRLTGDNSYTGGTQINTGARIIGDSNSITGNVINDGVLSFDQDTGATYANTVSGIGRLIKNGGGVLTLTGNNTHTGGTTVNDGALMVDGQIGNVAVQNSLIGGTGTLGNLTLAAGSVLTPGSSIGTIRSADANFGSTSAFEVEVNAAGESDRLEASGDVVVQDGAVVRVSAENGTDDGNTYNIGTRYTIITAEGGVSGAFEDVEEDFAYLTGNLSYDTNDVFLTLVRNNLRMRAIARTPNQVATADGLEELGFGFAPYDAVIVMTEQDALAAYDMLSGEMHASLGGMLIEDSRFVRDASLQRLRLTHGGAGTVPDIGSGWSVWGEGYGGSLNHDDDENLDLNHSAYGVILGADTAINEAWTIGVMGSAGRSKLDIGRAKSEADADSFSVGAYAGREFNNWGLRFGGSYTMHKVETDRHIDMAGLVEDLSADYDTETIQVYAELGHRFTAGSGVIEPFASVAHVYQKSEGFDEEGGTATLAVEKSETETSFATLGLRVETDFAYAENQSARVFGSAAWQRAFGDMDPVSEVRFDGGSTRDIHGMAIRENSGILEFGVASQISNQTDFSISFNRRMADDLVDQGVAAKLTFIF